MTNFNKPYSKKNRRTDGKLIRPVIYNASDNNKVLFKGKGSRVLTKEYIIDVKRQEIEEGLDDRKDRKKMEWMVDIAIAKTNNDVLKVYFIEEGELF
jgi:hypothetical protein